MDCELCHKPIPDGKENLYSFYGNPHRICPECYKAIFDISSFSREKRISGKSYVSDLLKENKYTPDIILELRRLLDLPVSSELRQNANQYIKANGKDNDFSFADTSTNTKSAYEASSDSYDSA